MLSNEFFIENKESLLLELLDRKSFGLFEGGIKSFKIDFSKFKHISFAFNIMYHTDGSNIPEIKKVVGILEEAGLKLSKDTNKTSKIHVSSDIVNQIQTILRKKEKTLSMQ